MLPITSRIMDAPPPPEPLFPGTDTRVLVYLATSAMLGALSALASLLGSQRILSWRVVGAYTVVGGLVALGVTLVAVDKIGFSYFLVGISIFAGYKAFDLMAAISLRLSQIIPRLLERIIGVTDASAAPPNTSTTSTSKPEPPQNHDE